MLLLSRFETLAGKSLKRIAKKGLLAVHSKDTYPYLSLLRSQKRLLSYVSDAEPPTTTTHVEPSVRHGPFGSGGTVVGYSKYDGVRSAFEENFARRLELGAQLVVYEKGQKIIDLHGYAPELDPTNGGNGYDGDTIQCVFSSGKNMEAIVMAMIVDRGLVSYDDLVTKYWPEFGANGKEHVTVADVMRHAGGVPFVLDPNNNEYSVPLTNEDLGDIEVLESKLANAEMWPPTDPSRSFPAMHYHALSRGWLVNGIVRRADPKGRTIRNFMSEEIVGPLGKDVKYFCGVSPEDQPKHHYADVSFGSLLYRLAFEIVPAFTGYGDSTTAEFIKILTKKEAVNRPPTTFVASPPDIGFYDSKLGRSLESPSFNMVANARSMAKINAAMAGDGSYVGVRLLSEEGVSTSMDKTVSDVFDGMDAQFSFSQGGFGDFQMEDHVDPYHYRHFHPDDKMAFGKFKGWGGFGGSLSLWDRDKGISFAYCMNAMGLNLVGGQRTRRILLELQKAIA